MRALLDTTLFISFLLSRQGSSSAVRTILEAASAGVFVLLFTPEVADEIERTIANRHDLARRIAPADVDALVLNLWDIAEALPRLDETIERVSRDPEDDYLIAQAIVARADYLVSRDNDLLDLRDDSVFISSFLNLRIVSPFEFLQAVRAK